MSRMPRNPAQLADDRPMRRQSWPGSSLRAPVRRTSQSPSAPTRSAPGPQVPVAVTYRAHILTPTGNSGWADWNDGRLDVLDGKIVHAGPWRKRGSELDPPKHYTDLRPHILFPGLVDTHAHVPQLPICGVHPEDLLEWLRKWTFPLERRFRGERALTLSRDFMREMLVQGTTSAALYTSAWPDSVEACFKAAEEVGVHAWIGPPLMDDGAYRKVTTKRVLDEARTLAKLDRPTLRFAVTPRFALSCTRELLEGCGDLAREKNLPIQTHLAEQQDECQAVRERFGQEYLEVYERAGLVTPQSLFAHAIWLTAREWQHLAPCAIAHCPTSNVFLGSGVMNWQRAQAARVGLGSDVGAGPDLSIFRVARMSWTVHLLEGRAPSPAELLRAATVGGAKALGFDDIGSLEQGKAADLIVLDWRQIVPAGAPTTESTDDLLSRILHRATRSSVRQVYVSGLLRHQRA
jgi:guanine deaminase